MLKYYKPRTEVFINKIRPFLIKLYKDEISEEERKRQRNYPEYTEFINLLKLYIDSREPLSSIIHLVYTNGESILLDQNKSLINLQDNIFNKKIC